MLKTCEKCYVTDAQKIITFAMVRNLAIKFLA